MRTTSPLRWITTVRLWLRVGPVFYGDGEGALKEKGVWIELTEMGETTGETIEFLMSRSTFEAMVEHFRRRFAMWDGPENIEIEWQLSKLFAEKTAKDEVAEKQA